MRKSVYISLVLVILMQSWIGGFWSVRSASAEESSMPVKKVPAACCASSDGAGMTPQAAHRDSSVPTSPCECPDAGDDCCCLRALAVNGGFVFGANAPPTFQPLRESDRHFLVPVFRSSPVLHQDREEISGTAPPIFKLKGCFLI